MSRVAVRNSRPTSKIIHYCVSLNTRSVITQIRTLPGALSRGILCIPAVMADCVLRDYLLSQYTRVRGLMNNVLLILNQHTRRRWPRQCMARVADGGPTLSNNYLFRIIGK